MTIDRIDRHMAAGSAIVAFAFVTAVARAAPPDRAGDRAAPPSLRAAVLAGSPSASVFKCEEQGKVVYSDQPCGANGRPVDVRPSEGYEGPRRKAQDAAAAAAEAAPVPAPAPVPAAQGFAPDPEAQRRQRCEWLGQAIQDNEDTARQPQAPQRQDSLTAARRKMLAEKESLGC